MDGKTVISCPDCEGEGKRLKRYPLETREIKITISSGDYIRCPMCEGSGRVFVIPARIIGPVRE